MTYGKDMTAFHAKAELKQTAQANILMSQVLICFKFGVGDSMPNRDKIVPYLGKTFFYLAS